MKSHRRLVFAACVLVLLAALGGSASGAPGKAALTTVTVDTLPIANGLPLDLGISKGFFAKHGIEIKKQLLQSGNDIVLALANHNGDIGYLGYVPAMIARTGHSADRGRGQRGGRDVRAGQLAGHPRLKGDSSIKTPADLAGKTI